MNSCGFRASLGRFLWVLVVQVAGLACVSAEFSGRLGGSISPRAYVKPTLSVAHWAGIYEPGDAREWSKRWNGGIHGGWFNGGNEGVAKGYITTWGPLGLRTYMHDRAWSREQAFLDRAPDLLRTAEGELFANAFEVLEVLPGSPAEGHLQPGDLIVGMEDQSLLSAEQVELPEPYHHQGTRSLALHAGMLLDRAEGSGKVSFNILRNPKPVRKESGGWEVRAEEKFSHHGNKPGHEFEVEVRGPGEVRLTVDDGGNGIGSDGFSWKDVCLKQAGKVEPLSARKGVIHHVGYGRASYDEETATWQAHATSEIRFTLPEGSWTLTTTGIPSGYATVTARIESRPILRMPKALVAQAKRIEFNIPKMGTFAEEPGGGCVKTANIVAQQAAWLATQQQEDGSWQRPQGYTGNHYDTAWAGLGLMATGDVSFDQNIRRAADFLAFKAKPDGWAVPSSSVAIFLSEYWLRYGDDRILPALEVWVNCLLVESLTGDYTAGHGHNPGYRGTGVSTGGSHAAAAFAVASKTPIDFDTTVLDRMLRRVQELAPDGHVPYGRGRGRTDFAPALDQGATYSGRHGPYLVASAVHGGPALFTENCIRMYAEGLKGGSDQGHATETLSTQWAFAAMAATDLQALRAHLAAMRWKITMRRCFDGGFCQSAFRLEYAGGESLLDYAIRSGSWLVALCAERRNLAITGHPKFRAQQLIDQPPVQHVDAMLHGQYLRDWAVVDAVLADRSPESLKAAIAELQTMSGQSDLRARMEELLKGQSRVIAKDVAVIDGVPPRIRAYLIEMLLGMNLRLTTTPVDGEAGAFEIVIDQQFPLAGLELDADQLELLEASLKGSIRFIPSGDLVPVPEEVPLDASEGVSWSNWHAKQSKVRVMGPTEAPFEIQAVFDFSLAGIPLRYERSVLFNQGEDYGNGEKERKVVNDRRVWVPGQLAQDHARWNASFVLPSGIKVAAATQGNEILVHQDAFEWISPRDRSLPMNVRGEICYTSGWQRFEARVPEFRFSGEVPRIGVTSLRQGDVTASAELLDGLAAAMPLKADGAIEVVLTEPATVRAFDLRADGVGSVVIEAMGEDGQWQVIHLGRPGELIKRPVKVKTGKLRITPDEVRADALLTMLRLYP